jgi:hypothetical protein
MVEIHYAHAKVTSLGEEIEAFIMGQDILHSSEV